MLYTLIYDSKNYREFHFDQNQIVRILDQEGYSDIEHRIDVNGEPKSFKYLVKEPLILTFPIIEKADKNKKIPDIEVSSGRLFLSEKAYQVLKPALENDGEFLPVTYENGQGYFFTPLHVAEDVDAINTELSQENGWNYFDHLVFYEDRVKEWSLFRMRHDGYRSVFCSNEIRQIIEDKQLTGLYITNDLANIFPEERSDVADLN